MNEADRQYKQIIDKISHEGYSNQDEQVRTVWKDGQPAYTKSIISESMRFTNKELPILTTKKVAWKTAIRELLWIWQKKSNQVEELRQMNVKIWNEWEQEDGTIGKAYGYQLAKRNRQYPIQKLKTNLLDPKNNTVSGDTMLLDQVDYLIQELVNNPSSRRHITMLWNPDELDEMSLTPCVYETQWHVKAGKLHLEVRCRSNDMGLGNPFNVFQYNVLQRMIAQVTGYELGEYIFHIGDAHIYERHIEPLEEQVNRESYPAPVLSINPEITSFYDFSIDDFSLNDYQHGDKVAMEIAI
ncbi:thymidylate synthase [Alkalicoccobacillus murimartini]|uniref:Thymidylate synthase n=1 Tax=Alkalicoccobacillus murimartini TaxID=171685 RepID=A0ABT9YEZ1_9BACI|nr:thymidylate synthase [Alkalicoccobacillus murimartini]MDQ0206188.1 thymidylate synthase [Alkalicoccobacillus murimartini]